MIYKCVDCSREFVNGYGLTNHRRYGCYTQREYKLCPTFNDNVKCQKTFKYSKSGLCRSCSSIKSFNDVRSGRSYEEMYGMSRAKMMRDNSTKRSKEWMKINAHRYLGVMNPNYGNSPWTKNLKWESIFGIEKCAVLKQKQSDRVSGKLSPFYGKNQSGTNNEYVKYIMNENGFDVEQYELLRGVWFIYKRDVWRVTNKQPYHLLDNYDKRGISGVCGAYHLDHIVSIRYGFENNISPDIIGDISNIQFIPWEVNIRKGSKVSI